MLYDELTHLRTQSAHGILLTLDIEYVYLSNNNYEKRTFTKKGGAFAPPFNTFIGYYLFLCPLPSQGIYGVKSCNEQEDHHAPDQEEQVVA